MGGKTVKAAAAALGLVLAVTAAMRTRPSARARAEKEAGVARWTAREVVGPAESAEQAVLGRPLALALDGGRLLVADAEDCAVKAFGLDGTFQGAFGRKGRGPGELTFPSGVSVAGERIFVADKLNSRIQVFDRDGRSAGGFPVPFLPDKVLALTPDALLVTGNPTGAREGETLLHAFDASGRPLWRGLQARFSGDPVYDAFRNMILVCPGDGGDFFVVRRSGEREVLRYGAGGELKASIDVDGRYVARNLDLPFPGGRKRLAGFCWAAAADGDLLYLAAPERVEGPDLGPGRELSVFDGRGSLRGVVVLPRPVHRFVVRGGRILAIDAEGELAVFEVARDAEERLCAGLEEAVPPGSGPALLVFFSTECSVCYEDLFEARYLVDKQRWPVAVVGVSAGPGGDLESFLEKHSWTRPVVHDRRRALFKRFRVDAPPYKVLLVGGAEAYRDDPRLPLEDRRKELERCMTRLFSH